MQKWIQRVFLWLVCLSFLAPLLVFKDLLFPYVTSKAFFFRIVIELALPCYIYLLIVSPRLRPKLKNPLTLSILAFWVLSLVSALLGNNVLKSLWGNFERMGGVYYLAHLILLYFYVLMLGEIKPGFLKAVLNFLIFIATVATLNGFFTKFGWLHIMYDPSLPVRISSTFGNPIFFASFLVVTMFLTLYFAFREEGWRRWLYWILVLLQFFGIYYSATRGAIVGLVGGLVITLVVYLFIAPNRLVKVVGSILLVVGVAGVISLFAYSSHFPQNTLLGRITHLQDTNSSARLVQWRTALEGFRDQPLFGTGSENYYVLSNKYFHPEIYKYDASWFDKPHNYFLEILVTNGIFGFLAYASLLVFALWGLFKAYRVGLLSRLEFLALLAGFLAYQIQNLFVFDTVSASLAFYVFIGLCGFLWEDIIIGKQAKTKPITLHPAFGATVFIVSSVVAVLVIYISNWLPAMAAKYVNYGYAYGAAGPGNAQIAENYFEQAVAAPFNFDPGESASRYQQTAVTIAGDRSGTLKPEFQDKVVNNSIAYMEYATGKVDNNPIYWQELASLYILKSYMQNRLDPHALDDINRAIVLAPKRVEPKSVLLQIMLLKGQVEQAKKLAQEIYQIYPSDPDKWQLVLVDRNSGNLEQAIALTKELMASNYGFRSYGDLGWLSEYYESKGQFAEAINVLTYLGKAGSQDYLVYFHLAKDYLAVGDKQRAVVFAQGALQLAPAPAQPEIQNFIKSVK